MTRSRPGVVLELAAGTAPATVEAAARELEGWAVPYGPVGSSSLGPITFAQGSLTWSEPGRVKLLRQHRADDSLGFALELDDRPEGLWSRFQVAEGDAGDLALAEAADGRRDGLSVGVLLDEDVLDQIVEKWIAGDTTPTAASGRLLEVSQVSIPAFDDARIPASQAAAQANGGLAALVAGHDAGALVTLAVTFQTPAPATAGEDNPARQETPTMTTPTPATAATAPAAVDTPPPAPAPNPAATAQVSSEAPVYTFDGRGPSFCRDVFRARFEADVEAMLRLNAFQERMAANDLSQVGMVTAAVETRTTAPNFINNGYKPELLVEVIDKGRPIVARVGTVNLTDATPFRVPVEGEMTGGVGDHTEGTAHVAEGDLAIGDATVTPGAISGAFRLSRELIDSSNPALDSIALRAMMRQYRYATEAKAVAALAAIDSVATVSINTVQKLRVEINNYYDLLLESPIVAAHSGFYGALLADVDTTGRPMLATVNPQNAAGTVLAGHTGAYVDGSEVFKSYSVTANDAYLFNPDDVLIGESPVRTFRFDEVEGPGVVKLALWSYFAAKVTRAASVVKVTSAGTD